MTWNPFGWTAGPFLTLYLTIAVIVLFWGFSVRSMIGPAAQEIPRLSGLELAYLAGGARRLGDAVLLSLTSENGAIIDLKRDKITVTDQAPLARLMSQPPLLSVEPSMTRQQFQTAVKPLVERVKERLQASGYYPTHDQMTAFRKSTLPFVVVLLVFGMIKALVGAERHRPIGILAFLLFVTAVAAIALTTYPRRTRAGSEVLQAYRTSHARASRAPLDHELLLAVALSGPVVLSGTDYAPIYALSKTMYGGGSFGSGSCGGGGCGGCSA